MVYLAPLFLIIISYIMGSLLCTGVKDKPVHPAEVCIIGTMSVLLLWEAIILPSIKLLASFAVVSVTYSIILIGIVVLSLILARKFIAQNMRVSEPISPVPVIIIGIILGIQIAFFFLFYPDRNYDFTLETVNTTLESDLIYENHPGMGSTFLYGITFRGKIVTFPLFIAYLAKLFPGNVPCLVYRSIPTWTLFCSFMVYGLWAKALFTEDKQGKKKGTFFLLGVGLLNIFGSFSKDCIFYYQMFRGFSGDTFCYTVLIPYAVYRSFQLFYNKKYGSVIYIMMVAMTCLCVTDVKKGFVPMIICMVISGIVALGYRIRRWLKCRQL